MANEQNLKPCKPGETHNPNGRPKNTLTELKGLGLSKTDCYNAIKYMLTLSKPDLKKVSESDIEPSYKVCVARAILKDIAKGYYSTVDSLFNRLFGKPQQEIIQTNYNTDFTPEDEDILRQEAKEEGISWEQYCEREGIQ